jgi:adenylate cyclase
LGLRPLLLQRWVAPAALEKRVRRQTQIDLGSYIAAGLGLTAFNHFVYRFPVESGLKLLIGIVTLGIFNALDLALDTERHMIKQAAAGGQRFAAHFRLESLTQNFAKGAVMVLALLGAIFFLVIKKDLRWLIGLSVNQLRAAERSVLIEVVFIIGVMMSLTIKLTVSYAKNLKIFFEHQTGVLNAVALGRLDTYVPIVGFNEFALIAQHTNTMIDSLREKARVESLFGKVVSPEIARRLLAGGEDGIKLGGTRRNLVILFSDLRNFTSFAEAQAPEAVMQFLNTYFTAMVTIIRQHGGLVDKFIGDGILAVFGLENPDEAASHAVQAAVSMVDACRQLATQLAIPVESGIGIHCGDVLAGNVGSQERLEFTFIGDVVNTASRVESATKQLQLPIVISEVVWKELAKESRALPWQDLGAHQLRGKAVPLTLFGLQPSGLSGS